jgi:hypothetical protein
MTKFNDLLTATPVQFAAVFGAVRAGSGPAPITPRSVPAVRPEGGEPGAAPRHRRDSKITGPFGAHGSSGLD